MNKSVLILMVLFSSSFATDRTSDSLVLDLIAKENPDAQLWLNRKVPMHLWKQVKIADDRVVELNFSGVHLKSLPREMRELTELKKLNLSGSWFQNPGTALVNLSQCSKLDTLILTRSAMSPLPFEISFLRGVSVLDLSSMQLREFPSELLYFPNLKSLNLSNNKIRVIPKEIRFCKSLEILNLSGNQIETIPSEIVELEQLKRLIITNGKLTSIPDSYDLPQSLVLFDVSSNPNLIKPPPPYPKYLRCTK